MSVSGDLIGLSKLRPVRLFALTSLIVGVGVKCFIDKLAVLDPDMWWHLRVGDWIVQNRSFPRSGIFSRTAATRSWMAYSWGYEVLLSRTYCGFSLVGMGAFGTLLASIASANESTAGKRVSTHRHTPAKCPPDASARRT